MCSEKKIIMITNAIQNERGRYNITTTSKSVHFTFKSGSLAGKG